MQLHELLAGLPGAQATGPTDIAIDSLAYDSRAAQPGGLFVAISGFHTDGHAFIGQALARGARAVVGERNATLIAVVHDLDLVLRLAERAVVLRRGQIVADIKVDADTPSALRGILR